MDNTASHSQAEVQQYHEKNLEEGKEVLFLDGLMKGSE